MGRLALVFPGQGSQAPGMGRELAAAFPAAAAIYEQANELLGRDIRALSFNGPAEELARTENAQVALYVNSAAVMAVLAGEGVAAGAVSGHSLGEYSALAAAGAINFQKGLELVARRGEAMSRAAAERPGAMAAVLGLEDEKVEELCREAGEVWPVNYNCPGQLVISGESDSVDRAVAAAAEAGARKAVALPVSGAFHSPLMRPAAGEMKGCLAAAGFQEPATPFISSISCQYEEAAALPELLVRQIVSPVRWRQTVGFMAAEGFDRFLEVGHGKVLSGLIRRIDGEAAALGTADPAGIEKALAALAAD